MAHGLPYGYWITPDGKKLPVLKKFGHSDVALKHLGKAGTFGASEAHAEMLKAGFTRVSIGEEPDGATLNFQMVHPLTDAQASALGSLRKQGDLGSVYVDVGLGIDIGDEEGEEFSFSAFENFGSIRGQIDSAAKKQQGASADAARPLGRTGKLKALVEQQSRPAGPQPRTLQTGKRGGRFVLTATGRRVYVKQ